VPCPRPKYVGAFAPSGPYREVPTAVSSHHDKVLVSPLGNDPGTFWLRASCSELATHEWCAALELSQVSPKASVLQTAWTPYPHSDALNGSPGKNCTHNIRFVGAALCWLSYGTIA
jgi:hypothetical protein